MLSTPLIVHEAKINTSSDPSKPPTNTSGILISTLYISIVDIKLALFISILSSMKQVIAEQVMGYPLIRTFIVLLAAYN